MKIDCDEILQAIYSERVRQMIKWGEQSHHDLKWLSILVEEVGEVAEIVNEDSPAYERLASHKTLQNKLESELIQVAAVAVAWIESIQKKGVDDGKEKRAQV